MAWFGVLAATRGQLSYFSEIFRILCIGMDSRAGTKSVRSWWDDEDLKNDLTIRVNSAEWYVKFKDGTPGRVMLICWGGYKVELPDGKTRLANPNFSEVIDVSCESYPQLVEVWHAKQVQIAQEKIEQEARVNAGKAALELFQTNCLHETTTSTDVMRHPACDVNDTTCLTCGKLLRKSWSTNNDRDPNDHISDWEWWCREHQKLYGSLPNRIDYDVVKVITGDRF